MRARLVLAIISTMLEETALAVIVLFGLPRWLGIEIPLLGLIALMLVWLTYSVAIYRIGSRALRRKPSISLLDMVGSKGKVVSALSPEGLVRVNGELWVAKSVSSTVEPGGAIVVVGQDSLKLVVRGSSAVDGSGNPE